MSYPFFSRLSVFLPGYPFYLTAIRFFSRLSVFFRLSVFSNGYPFFSGYPFLLFKKMLKMKNGRHFQAKKTSATPDFCKRNPFRTHGLGVMNVLCFGGTQNAN